MPTSEFYRKQAQLCANLAKRSDSPLASERYVALALEFLLRADELDRRAGVAPAAPPSPPDRARGAADGGPPADRPMRRSR